VITALHRRAQHPSAIVREHVQWALAQHQPAALDS
jgi:epoxyqueuosine reductase